MHLQNASWKCILKTHPKMHPADGDGAGFCRLWKQAYYNASNCEALVSCAAELQGLVLANSSLAARPTLMANLLEAVTEVKEFIATFSERSAALMPLSVCLPACMPA